MTASNVRTAPRITCLLIVLLFTGFITIAGCATAPEPEPQAEALPEAQPEAEPQPDTESAEPEEKDSAEADTDGAQEEAPVPEDEPDDAPDAEEDYAVSEEVYNQTFSEVEQTIQELNQIIREQDFDEWRSYLTEDYEQVYSDPERLREISSMPILQRNDIVLESLRDYFRWVVVPSRANARLDDLRFVTKTDVEAIMSVNGQRVILYHLKKVDGSWKIDAS